MRTHTKAGTQYSIPLKYRVRSWLDGQGKSQKWLAAQVGVHPAYLANILAGSRCPSLAVAKKLEDITGIPAGEFLPVPLPVPVPVTVGE